MKLLGLLLLVILRSSDAANHPDPDIECQDCNENGPWWPLFKPSQIISSEFPEHGQYRSQEASHPLTYATSGSQYQECEDGPPPPPAHVVNLGSHEVAGIDSPVKSYGGSGGEHRVEWDHYGDVTTVATVAYNSLEDRSGDLQRGRVPHDGRVSGEDRSDAGGNFSGQGGRREDIPAQDTSASLRSQEASSFFDEGSFFNENLASPKDNFPEDFEVSNEYPYSEEHHHNSNSIENLNSHENFGRAKKPVATSYASISSVFESRPISRSRDLLHPDISYNEISHYIKNQIKNPGFDGRNFTKQYLVHEPHSEEPGVLHINHGIAGGFPGTFPRNNKPTVAFSPFGPRPSSYVPLDHPVYRYVKVHGGLPHFHRRPSIMRASTLRLEDVHPQLRSKFPFKYLRPRVHVQKQESFVHHVVPTKDPFSDSFWKESQKIENLKPPPLGQTLYLFKKKPNPLENKNIARRRQSPGYVYIIRRNKKH